MAMELPLKNRLPIEVNPQLSFWQKWFFATRPTQIFAKV